MTLFITRYFIQYVQVSQAFTNDLDRFGQILLRNHKRGCKANAVPQKHKIHLNKKKKGRGGEGI